METGACALYDGTTFHLGLAPSFEWPLTVTRMILNGEADASSAFKRLGLTEHEKLGAMDGGILGMLSDGTVSREDFSKTSILMAIIQINKKKMYSTHT
jgi:non-canonical (house-cleaning) NTP pyrophosphatase